MAGRLHDKVVVVTGSTRGIGRAIVEACAREGARVVLCSRSEESVAEAVEALRREGLQASGLAVDVTRRGDLERLLEHADEAWGRVDVWVNNAGISSGFQPLHETTEEEVRAVVDTNLTAVLLACRLAIPYFLGQGGGTLVNMSGRGGRGDAVPFMVPYACTKAAVVSLTRSLAKEHRGKPISIHAVQPGMVATDLYRGGRLSPHLEAQARDVPLVLQAIGVPAEEVGRLFVEIAAQQPGRITGKTYSLFKGWRMVRGLSRLMWHRVTGRISG